MARARNLKPSIFKNEILGTADPLYTLLFEGLWCHADREGRLEDRPMRIKAEIFPYRENIDMSGMLDWLAENKFIHRYSVSSENYIQIINFKKHQNPHVKEGASTIPAPDSPGAAPCKHGASSGNAGTSPADSLNPLTSNLNPQPYVSDPIGSDVGSKAASCPQTAIIDLYHEILPMCPRVREWTPTREGYLRARWREDAKRQSLDWWKKFFEYIKKSKFLTGQARARNEDTPPFVASLEWILRPSNFAKIIEGNYHRGR